MKPPLPAVLPCVLRSGIAPRRLLPALGVLCVAALSLLSGCRLLSGRSAVPAAQTVQAPGEAGAAVPVRFEDITRQAGINFRHNNGAAGKKYMPETVGSGCAFFDFDNDGYQDLLFVNSDNWPGLPDRHETSRLYRNDGTGQFSDITREAGLAFEHYGMGVAVGDFDNDGWRDLYLTAIGANRLLRNTLGDKGRKGKPIFEDVTRKAGVAGVAFPRVGLRWKWSSSAAWLDYDRDGKLDLFVLNYVNWSPKLDIWCGTPGGRKSYCPPERFEGLPPTLYHNEGGGRFRDASRETGIAGPRTIGKCFGIAVADYNQDGWPDVAVANDTWPNFLFLNQGGRRFIEAGLESGISYDEGGSAKAGMGIDAADWNNDGRFGLLVGNFSAQGLSLFQNEEVEKDSVMFTDIAPRNGVASASWNYLTFGLFFFDYDLDGYPDLLAANGHIDDMVSEKEAMITYKERPLLFRNRGANRFEEVGKRSGPAMNKEVVGRGLAYGDVDNDGDLDVALVANGQQGLLYRNDGGDSNRWIRFRTIGVRSNRDGIGALIRVTSGGATRSQYVKSGGSFLSESQLEPTFGLGKLEMVESAEVVWPSGVKDRSGPLRGGHQYVVQEGRGFAEDPRWRSTKSKE